MRFNQRCTFILLGEPTFDYGKSKEKREVIVSKTLPCQIMALGWEKSQELFGDYLKDLKTIYIQNKPPFNPDVIQIEKNYYHPKVQRLNSKVWIAEKVTEREIRI